MCWVTARLSQVAGIEQVVALDMSERLLTQVGTRIIEQRGCDSRKVAFAVGSFNEIPFPAESFD
jgi:ubiquinone/menaquinone biosynthesis C-methylase UbiE